MPIWYSLTLRGLRQDWRSGETRILALALAVAVAALSAVGFFTDRIRQGMARQATELLAADLLVQSHRALPAALADRAQARGLRTATTVSFRSMLVTDADMLLSEVKALGPGYPLRGHLRVQERPDGPESVATGIPAPGTLWVESRLLARLGLRLGDTLELGEARFTLGALLSFEPDRGGEVFQLAPRVMLNQADLARTGLLGPGSRVTHRLLLAGPPEAVAAYRRELEAEVGRDWEIQTVREARPELRAALQQAERFLGLAAIAAVLLAGAAVAVSARHFARRQADAAAIMRCLGATQGLVLRVYLLRLLALGLFAASLGNLLGYALQGGLAQLLRDFFPQDLPPPGMGPLWLGYATGLATLLGFAFPSVLRIRDVPPLRVLRRDLGPPPPALWQAAGLAFLVLGGLVYWQAGEARLAGLMLGGLCATLLLLFGAAWGLVRALRGLRHHAHVAWRFGLANLARRAQASAVQLAGFGLGLLALLLLAVVRVDLLDAWQTDLPPDTPNHFAVNIQPQDAGAFAEHFRAAGLPAPRLYPMVPGHLRRINARSVDPDAYPEGRAQRLARRAFNLSWSEHLPPDNTLLAGAWIAGPGQASVESGIAETLGIALGDTLYFEIMGREVAATVTSLRKLRWDSFNVNFFVLLSPDLLQEVPATYLTSFYLPAGREAMLNALVRDLPSVTMLEVAALLAQVRGVMERAVLAVEYVFLLTLAAGLLVLYAAIQASQEERLHEGAVLRTLGASRGQVLAALLAEFLTLGALAGLLASAAASALGYVLAAQVFELPYAFNPWLWLAGTAGGALGVGLAGVLGTYRLLRHPPAAVLRGIDD